MNIMDVVEPSLGLGFDSAIKVLEVTAQEIVDRINKPCEERVEGDKLHDQGKVVEKATKLETRLSTSSEPEVTDHSPKTKVSVSEKPGTAVAIQSSVDQQSPMSGTDVESPAAASAATPSRPQESRKDSMQTILQNKKIGELLNELQVPLI